MNDRLRTIEEQSPELKQQIDPELDPIMNAPPLNTIVESQTDYPEVF